MPLYDRAPQRVQRCTTHHACDCREWDREQCRAFLRDFLDWSSRPVVHARDRARRATALAVLEARASELLGEEKADGR